MNALQMTITTKDYNNYMHLLEMKIQDIKIDYYKMSTNDDKKWYVGAFKNTQHDYFTKWVELNKTLKKDSRNGYYLATKENEIKQNLLNYI